VVTIIFTATGDGGDGNDGDDDGGGLDDEGY
jgi:hypothetical protein